AIRFASQAPPRPLACNSCLAEGGVFMTMSVSLRLAVVGAAFAFLAAIVVGAL
ncbi:MAG: hypothetical protein IT534_08950, partial [Bauldia sp.]|nr:hypothetical protein [Bauldia sp.]